MPSYPIVDLHSDLLSFLVDHPLKTFEDPDSKASHLQMRQGNVVFQALTIFSATNSSAYEYGKKQFKMFLNLLSQYPEKFKLWNPQEQIQQTSGPISIALVFENAHSICE